MALSAQLKQNQQAVPARLDLAYSGVTHFTGTGWGHSQADDWVIDYINHCQQPQRIGTGLTGEPPYRTVRRLKVQAAKQLLLQDRLNVKETAPGWAFLRNFSSPGPSNWWKGLPRNAACKP